jgi:hypothetical protein
MVVTGKTSVPVVKSFNTKVISFLGLYAELVSAPFSCSDLPVFGTSPVDFSAIYK